MKFVQFHELYLGFKTSKQIIEENLRSSSNPASRLQGESTFLFKFTRSLKLMLYCCFAIKPLTLFSVIF